MIDLVNQRLNILDAILAERDSDGLRLVVGYALSGPSRNLCVGAKNKSELDKRSLHKRHLAAGREGAHVSPALVGVIRVTAMPLVCDEN
jgi:hypothetical protein